MENKEDIFNEENKELLKRTISTMVKSGKPKEEIIGDFTELFIKTGIISPDPNALLVDLEKLEIRQQTDEETASEIIDKLLSKINKDNVPRQKSNPKIFVYKVPEAYKNLSENEAKQRIKNDLLKCMQTAGWTEEEINKPLKDLQFKDGLQISISQITPDKNTIDGFTEYFYQKLKKGPTIKGYRKQQTNPDEENKKEDIDTIKRILNKYKITRRIELERLLMFFDKLDQYYRYLNQGGKPKRPPRSNHNEERNPEERRKRHNNPDYEPPDSRKIMSKILFDPEAYNGFVPPIDRDTMTQMRKNPLETRDDFDEMRNEIAEQQKLAKEEDPNADILSKLF